MNFLESGASVLIPASACSRCSISTPANIICLLQEGTDYLACFTDGDSALEFRSLLGLQEHVDLCSTTLERSPSRISGWTAKASPSSAARKP